MPGSPNASSVESHLDLAETSPADFNRLLKEFSEGDPENALEDLACLLNEAREVLAPQHWKSFVRDSRRHPLWGALQEDPYTRRAFEKPRGYAGDAVLLDFLYHGPPAELSGRAMRISKATTTCPSARSVVFRRDLIAQEIDAVAERVEAPRVLAVACGHLREAERSRAVREASVSEVVALDQDKESIARVATECASFAVTPVVGSVSQLIRRKLSLGTFDFIYAAGLYDYLNDRTAEALTRALLSLLNPAGHLLVGNFTPENHGRGYMEVVMDWHLLYRDQAALRALGEEVGAEATDVTLDPWGNVAYLRLERGP